MTLVDPAETVLRCEDVPAATLKDLMASYGLEITRVPRHRPIPGSFWGEPEAGLVKNRLHIRPDTPVHSALHEACHFVCMDRTRRRGLHTNAGGDFQEEEAVCYLQVLLADLVPGYGRAGMFADMDAWGYSFRLGSSQRWFELDAETAKVWLAERGVTDSRDHPTWRLRE